MPMICRSHRAAGALRLVVIAVVSGVLLPAVTLAASSDGAISVPARPDTLGGSPTTGHVEPQTSAPVRVGRSSPPAEQSARSSGLNARPGIKGDTLPANPGAGPLARAHMGTPLRGMPSITRLRAAPQGPTKALRPVANRIVHAAAGTRAGDAARLPFAGMNPGTPGARVGAAASSAAALTAHAPGALSSVPGSTNRYLLKPGLSSRSGTVGGPSAIHSAVIGGLGVTGKTLSGGIDGGTLRRRY